MLQLVGPQHVVVHELVLPPQVQGFVLHLIGCPDVPVSPFLQPAEVPLNSSTALWCMSHSSQLCVISKLIEGTLCPII